MRVYGASVSYYTGKLETYLHYKGIAYERGSPYEDIREIKEQVGSIQHPMVNPRDGRWMSDSTPMILQLETEYPDRGILPEDPVVEFVAHLIEDYADEWLWRAAMHYRWSYDHDLELLSRILANELTAHLKVPRFWRCSMVKRRQQTGFVINDGVTPMLQEVCETHLLQLTANAEAWHKSQEKFSMTIQGCHYQNLPVSRYRVYCLEMLRERFAALDEAAQNAVQSLLPFAPAAILWQSDVQAQSGYDKERQAPFNKAINVFEDGVPS